MRPLALLLLVLALVASGCGDSGDFSTGSTDPAPVETPSEAEVAAARAAEPPQVADPQPVPAATRRQLETGTIGLFDAFGRTSVRPDRVDFAQDASLEGVRWTRWDATGARGTGTMRSNDCDPSCAEGKIETVRATITLSAPRACKGPRYWSKSDVTPETGTQPFSYVRAPC